MPRAKLSVSVPAGTWVHDVSVAHPDAVFRVLAVQSGTTGDRDGRSDATGDGHGQRAVGGVALVEVRTGEPAAVVAAVERRDDVAALDLLWTRADAAMLQVETTDPQLLVPLRQAAVPLRTPFEVADGTATWETTTDTGRLSALGTSLETAGVAFEVEYVRDGPSASADRRLTDRQREVLVAAADRGYYDTPRHATLTEVAESLDVAKSTASDLLHRAESAVVAWFLEEHPAGT